MQPTDALKRLMTDHTPLYAGNRVPVRFADQPHYAGDEHGGPYLAVNPDVNGWYDTDVSGANELRLLRDTLSHEAYEYRMGNPSAKEALMRRHNGSYEPEPDEDDDGVQMTMPFSPKARAAGALYNILRDAWVNTQRCRAFPGLRRTFAFKADLLAGDTDVSELPPAEAMLAGVHQIALTNTATGIRDADPEVRSALAAARRYVERSRTAADHDELIALAEGLFLRFEDFFDEAEDDFEEFVEAVVDALDDLRPDNIVEDMDDGEVDAAIDAADLPDDLAPDDDSDASGGAPEDAETPEDGSCADSDSTEGDSTSTGADTAAGVEGGPESDEDGRVLTDMDRLDGDDRAAGDMVGIDDGDDYHEPDAGDEIRYEQMRREEAFAGTDWAERMEARDEYFRSERNDLPSEEIQALMRESGLAEDLRRAFSRIKTAEVSESTSTQTNSLHLGNVVRHMAGDYGVRDVYETTKRGATGGRTIAGVVDASGSMDWSGSLGEGAIIDAKVVLAALHIAATEIGDRVVATAFDSSAEDDVRLITGPDETFKFEHLDGFTGHSGNTSTAAGVMDGIRLLNRAGGKERVMVVITDGGANRALRGTRWESFTTGDKLGDARLAVEMARDEGITVIGVGVGSGISESKLEDTFGDGWVHVEADGLVDEVVRIYREHLDDDRLVEL